MSTERKVKISLTIYIITACVFGLLIANLDCQSVPFIISACILSLIMATCGFLIYIQPQWVSRLHAGPVQHQALYCPCVPFLPLFAIFLNAILMMHLSYKTWLRFVVWIGIGLFVYFTYSIRNSNLSERNRNIQSIEEAIQSVCIDTVNGTTLERTPGRRESTNIPEIVLGRSASRRESMCLSEHASGYVPSMRESTCISKHALGRPPFKRQSTCIPTNTSERAPLRRQSTCIPVCVSERAPSRRNSIYIPVSVSERTVTRRESTCIPVCVSERAFARRGSTHVEALHIPYHVKVSNGSRKSSPNPKNNSHLPFNNRRQSCSTTVIPENHNQVTPPWKQPPSEVTESATSRDENVTTRLRQWRYFLRDQAGESKSGSKVSKLHRMGSPILEVPGTDI